jgi:hypothetical protein
MRWVREARVAAAEGRCQGQRSTRSRIYACLQAGDEVWWRCGGKQRATSCARRHATHARRAAPCLKGCPAEPCRFAAQSIPVA